MPEIEKAATCYADTKVKEIVPEGVLCEKDGKEFVIEADSVVCALGFRAPYDKVDALCDKWMNIISSVTARTSDRSITQPIRLITQQCVCKKRRENGWRS